MWPNARISVMGGEQAANVLAQVQRQRFVREKREWTEEEDALFKRSITERFEREASPLYASARLWDDGRSMLLILSKNREMFGKLFKFD